MKYLLDNDEQYKNCWVDRLKIQKLDDTKNVNNRRHKAINHRLYISM